LVGSASVVGVRTTSCLPGDSGVQFWLTESLTKSFAGIGPVTVAETVVVPADGVFVAGARATVIPPEEVLDALQFTRSVDQV
jgi:hypothetical protein